MKAFLLQAEKMLLTKKEIYKRLSNNYIDNKLWLFSFGKIEFYFGLQEKNFRKTIFYENNFSEFLKRLKDTTNTIYEETQKTLNLEQYLEQLENNFSYLFIRSYENERSFHALRNADYYSANMTTRSIKDILRGIQKKINFFHQNEDDTSKQISITFENNLSIVFLPKEISKRHKEERKYRIILNSSLDFNSEDIF